ncbi:hypothetical protein N9954_09415 [Maribacter sp.]|nr:hypothetical protein [Maribacter sp.]
MKTLFTYRVNRISAYFALWCFIIGNVLFLLFLATEADIVGGTGVTFMAVLIVLTPISLLILLLNALFNLNDIRQHLTAIFMVLLNIPLAILYLKIITTI